MLKLVQTYDFIGISLNPVHSPIGFQISLSCLLLSKYSKLVYLNWYYFQIPNCQNCQNTSGFLEEHDQKDSYNGHQIWMQILQFQKVYQLITRYINFVQSIVYLLNIMPTFLESHFKIQQLESRLNKNEYLSNECLPNFVDAQVFKALKTSDKIPKRDVYPHFYHWYILMRQFSERTIQMWLKDHEADFKKDKAIHEVVKVIKETRKQNKDNNIIDSGSLKASLILEVSNMSQNKWIKDSAKKQSDKAQQQFHRNYIDLAKPSSHIQKKPRSQYDSVASYIMDIKLTSDINTGYENIRKMFQEQTVKLQSIKIINGGNGNQEKYSGYDIRVFFMTVAHVCEDLKNKILRCSNVENIQCKKEKRNQSR